MLKRASIVKTAPAAKLRIETARLVLRAPLLADFEPLAEMWGDAAVTRHILDQPMSHEAAWGKFMRDAGHWSLLGYGFWIVELRNGGAFAGQVGFAQFRREIDFDDEERPEIGWALRADLHGQGLASEAVGAALAWGDKRFGAKKPWCMINPDNTASLRVAHKHGFREFARTEYNGRVVLLLQR